MRKAKRQVCIHLLGKYHKEGVFPRNFTFPKERRPCFIDDNGNICAVGYLIENSEGRMAAEKINHKYKYSAVYEMHDANLDEWIDKSGLSKVEVAMIQPSYGYTQTMEQENKGFEYFEGAVIGLNISASVLNFLDISNERKGGFDIALGIVGGTLGIISSATDDAFHPFLDILFAVPSIILSLKNLTQEKAVETPVEEVKSIKKSSLNFSLKKGEIPHLAFCMSF